MFEIGELIVYGTTGMCTITSIGPLSMRGVDRKRLYYTLQPLHQDGAVYVPMEGEKLKAMRYPISAEEAQALMARIPEIEACDIRHFNYKQRTDAFSAALHENNCDSLVSIIKAVERRQRHFRDKQQYNVDNNFMKRAMGLLCGELAYALDLPMQEVRDQVEIAIRKRSPKEAHHTEETESAPEAVNA